MWWPNVLLLLLSAQLGSTLQNLPGQDHHLFCVNDYVRTINCTLSVAPGPGPPPRHASLWLTFSPTDVPVVVCASPERTQDDCTLTNTGGSNYSCSFWSPDDDSFSTSTDFRIDLCLGVNRSAVLLDEEYAPRYNITPIAPSNLQVEVNSNSSQIIFSWESSYERYLPNFYLDKYLKYELLMDRDGHTVGPFSSFKLTSFTADASVLDAGEYVARVRSAPEGSDYLGHWSQWSQEFRFRAPGKTEGRRDRVGLDLRLTVSLCILVPGFLVMCYVPILRWRKHTFIPTPVLNFSPLTSNYTENKSWAPSVALGPAQRENTAQIDVLIKCPDEDCKAWPSQHPAGERAAPCSDAQKPAPEVSYPCVPYAVTPVHDVKNIWEPDSRSEEPSDGRFCGAGPLDGDQRPYRNAYCSLTDGQCALDQQGSAGGGAPPTDDQSSPAGKVAAEYQNGPHLHCGTH